MKLRTRSQVVSLLVLLVLGIGMSQSVWADVTFEAEQPPEDRVVALAEQLRLGISVASFAVSAPTLQDLRVHAQQLINLLEGPEGRHYARVEGIDIVPWGLVPEAAAWVRRFTEGVFEPTLRPQVSIAARNVYIYLDLALDAALSLLNKRRLDLASTDMLRVYAYLTAAYERPTDVATIPALGTILRVLEAAEADPPIE
ncbi:hypothetical protein JW848_03835 [Candidatus Bipolaricaulota bacterium]|nr:hypothetical protein [Candidatus Bipolaricaulota bacterium]